MKAWAGHPPTPFRTLRNSAAAGQTTNFTRSGSLALRTRLFFWHVTSRVSVFTPVCRSLGWPADDKGTYDDSRTNKARCKRAR
jgi:hypothetical protein